MSTLFDIGEPVKRCTKCGKVKPAEDFFWVKSRRVTIPKRHSQCKVCHKAQCRAREIFIWSLPESDPRRQKLQKSRKKTFLKGRYGISLEQYQAMLAQQGGVCAICKGPPTKQGTYFHVDHHHTSGKVRGLLCGRCNVAIGMLQESPELLQRAIDYLMSMD